MKSLYLPLFLLVILPAQSSFADGNSDIEALEQTEASEWTSAQGSSKADTVESVNQASDASFDKRLPPVIPGERLGDSGKQVRVWSTAGAVSKSVAPKAPEAPQIPQTEALPENTTVIVDQRQ